MNIPGNIIFDPVAGTGLLEAINTTIDLAKKLNHPVRLQFNGHESDITDMANIEIEVQRYHKYCEERKDAK